MLGSSILFSASFLASVSVRVFQQKTHHSVPHPSHHHIHSFSAIKIQNAGNRQLTIDIMNINIHDVYGTDHSNSCHWSFQINAEFPEKKNRKTHG